MDKVEIVVRFSSVMARRSQVPDFRICVEPNLKQALPAVNAEVIRHIGETTLFAVLYKKKNINLYDDKVTLANGDELTVVPVVLGG